MSNPYRTAADKPTTQAEEIVEYLRECARNTTPGLGPKEDRNTVLIRFGRLLADEIEKRWGTHK